MSSTARHLEVGADASAFAFVEHITLESSEPRVPSVGTSAGDAAVVSQAFESRFHGCSTEVSLLGRHALGVSSVRRDGSNLQYTVHLRFARPSPVRVHAFSWNWLAVTVSAGLLGAAAFMTAGQAEGSRLAVSLTAGAVFLLVSLIAAYLCCRRATASLEVRSRDGDAPLVRITGWLLGLRGHRAFFEELARRAEAAHADDVTTTQQFLRDQMREHHRLFQLGVLDRREYEASKGRILAAHSPAGR